jgi:monooxygenase
VIRPAPPLQTDRSLQITGKSIAPAPSILNYLKGVSKRHGIDHHIKFHHIVLGLDWSSDLQKWRVEVQVGEGKQKTFWARFVIMSTGYYDYNEVRMQEPIPPD